LAKTFEIDFKFFRPLFLYATKGQFFIPNATTTRACMALTHTQAHTHTHTHVQIHIHSDQVRRPNTFKLAALFMSFGLGLARIAFCLVEPSFSPHLTPPFIPSSQYLSHSIPLSLPLPLALAIDCQFSLSATHKFNK